MAELTTTDILDEVRRIHAALTAAREGQPESPFKDAVEMAEASLSGLESALQGNPVPPTPVPPPSTGNTGPTSPPTSPGGTGPGPSPSPTGHRPVLAFTTSATPADPIAGNLIYQFTWADVNPAPGQYDFTKVEAAMQPWVDAGKLVPLRAFQHVLGDGRQGTPQWVLDIVGVVDPALHVPNYFDAQYEPMRHGFTAAYWAWLSNYAHRDKVAWVEHPFGIFGETKVDSEQGHTVDLAAWQRAGYTDAAWNTLLLNEATHAINTRDAVGLSHIPIVANMDRSFIGGDPAFTAEQLGAELRTLGFWLGDHGYRQGVTPSPMYLAGPSIYEQYLASSKTGNNADTEVREMVAYADAHGGFVLVYSSDIQHALSALHWANG